MAVPDVISARAHITFRDHWNKTSTVRFLTTQAIYTGWLADTASALPKALFDAIAALSACVEVNRGINNALDNGTIVIPSSEEAVNSSKLLVSVVDSVNGYADRFYIPGRDTSKYTSAGGFVITSVADATEEVTALITAVANGVMQSRYGHGVVVTSIKPVGRHLRRQ